MAKLDRLSRFIVVAARGGCDKRCSEVCRKRRACLFWYVSAPPRASLAREIVTLTVSAAADIPLNHAGGARQRVTSFRFSGGTGAAWATRLSPSAFVEHLPLRELQPAAQSSRMDAPSRDSGHGLPRRTHAAWTRYDGFRWLPRSGASGGQGAARAMAEDWKARPTPAKLPGTTRRRSDRWRLRRRARRSGRRRDDVRERRQVSWLHPMRVPPGPRSLAASRRWRRHSPALHPWQRATAAVSTPVFTHS